MGIHNSFNNNEDGNDDNDDDGGNDDDDDDDDNDDDDGDATNRQKDPNDISPIFNTINNHKKRTIMDNPDRAIIKRALTKNKESFNQRFIVGKTITQLLELNYVAVTFFKASNPF